MQETQKYVSKYTLDIEASVCPIWQFKTFNEITLAILKFKVTN